MLFEESCFTRLRLSALQANDGDESETSATLASQKPREKRVLIRGSLPSIQTANEAPAEAKPSDGDRRSKAVSKIKSLLQLISLAPNISLLVRIRIVIIIIIVIKIRIVIIIFVKSIGKLSF